MANLTDDVARTVRELWRVNLALGFHSRVGFEADTLGRLAKAAGATEATVQAWMSGSVQPSTSQALAVLDALPYPVTGPLAAAAMNGNGSHG